MNKLASVFVFFVALAVFVMWKPDAEAFMRYKDSGTGGTWCAQCHGDFTDDVSPKGDLFPSGGKHGMHRNSGDMNTECDLCHSSGDNRNPFIGLSDGTANNPGLGCTGCHEQTGLRAHHDINGVTTCAVCHTDDPPPPSEGVMPAYYGTADTNADMPCNPDALEGINENWTIGDTEGLDNDGDNIYDGSDPDCQVGPVCGDGVVDPGEDCDDGAANGDTACGCQTNCSYTPAGTSCPDGAFCNGDETCNGSGTCQPGTPVDCSDGVGCTDDVCDENADICRNTVNNANCADDGLFCNGIEFCDPINDCSSQGEPCGPGTVCNEETDTCDQQANCGDGVVDTGEDCDDGAANGTTTCGCQSDCTYTTSGISCDDGQFCNVGETCDGAGACSSGSLNPCSDGVSCTDDSCDEVNDTCVSTANDANCPDNGLFCDGTEFCDPVADCSSTGDPCLPGTSCNEDFDTCDEVCTPTENKEVSCSDNADNDCDGLIDCDDSQCRRDPACAPPAEICDDNIDNDGDGKTDCSDKKDCGKDPACAPSAEICDDNIDNDGDGKTDCSDKKDCGKDPACI